MLTLTTPEAKKASNEELAQAILDNADGSAVGNSLAIIAAQELARRTLPSYKQVDGVGQQPHGNASQGHAEPSALEKRIIQQIKNSIRI